MKKLKVFSICSGVGGMDLPFHQDQSFEVVGVSEIDPHASAILKFHFPEVTNYGDITKVEPKELPDFEIFIGGTPCQDLSLAGKRRGLKGKKSSLFYTYVEILRVKRPLYFIWENVGGTFSSQGGWDFARVQVELAKAGYSFRWDYLNAVEYGVPQKRERVFILGIRNDYSGRQILSFRNPNEEDIEFKQDEQSREEIFIATKYLGRNGRLINKKCPTIQTSDIPHIVTRPRGFNKGGLSDTCPPITTSAFNQNNFLAGKDRNKLREISEANCIDASYHKGPDNPGQRTLVAYSSSGRPWGREERVITDAANTLTTGEGCRAQSSANFVVDDSTKIRRLTPLECERLMSWPNNWTKFGNYSGVVKEVSDTQRYRCCGNGVVSKCVEPIKDLILQAEFLF